MKQPNPPSTDPSIAQSALITAREALSRVMQELWNAEVAYSKGDVYGALGCLMDQDKNVKVAITLARVAVKFSER